MSRKYATKANPTITIDGEKEIYNLSLSAISEYMNSLYSKGVIDEFEELFDRFDGLIDTVLQGADDDDHIAHLKKQLTLLRETNFMLRELMWTTAK